ncbi:hypothetical protein [Rhodophyticola porphyridii]|uniref:hypothetical protein n=1 Tax=Rhodophyticola porphyridii TaxID=1852017 RepID=UPI0035D04DC8
MNAFRPCDGIYLGDGEWLSWDDFGDLDPDEPQRARLPVLEWEDALTTRFPKSEASVIRQFVRLPRAAREYLDQTGRHLNIYGALGELYGAMSWGICLHRKPNAQGSDGSLDGSFVEIKTLGPRSKSERVKVKLSGHFSKLLLVKIDGGLHDELGGFRMTGRLIDRKALTGATRGMAGIKWSRACEIGSPPPKP